MRWTRVLAVVALAVLLSPSAAAQDQISAAANACTTIQSGELLTSDGEVIEPGFDDWGYNYQAHLFNGYYCDAYRDAVWCQEYADVELSMKWNEPWLSNKDCTGDGVLDRHLGHPSYVGSGAWITNHMAGRYQDGKRRCRWTYFVKIVAAPADADKIGGYWYAANGDPIGPVIWEAFAIIQEVINDSCAGETGLAFLSPVGPGFGKFKPHD